MRGSALLLLLGFPRLKLGINFSPKIYSIKKCHRKDGILEAPPLGLEPRTL